MRYITLIITFFLILWFSIGAKQSQAGACMCPLESQQICHWYRSSLKSGYLEWVYDCYAQWYCPIGPDCTGTVSPFIVCSAGQVACGTPDNPSCCNVPTSAPPPPPPPGCTPSCGGSYCGSKSDGCGGTCPCRECNACLPQCGQVSDCGYCSPGDGWGPLPPTIITPNGTEADPTLYNINGASSVVNLSWLSNSTLTDYYQVYVENSTYGTVWNNTNVVATSIGSSGYTSGIYHWYVEAVNSTCVLAAGATSVNGYFMTNSIPTVDSLTLKNADGVVVPVEAGDQNQICQTTFSNSSNDRRIIFEASVSDSDGWADVDTATLNWNGHNYAMSKLSGVGTGGTMRAAVDFGVGENNSGVFPLSVSVSDNNGSSNNYAFRNLKVWDCQVSVVGTLYDGSSGQACNEVGFLESVDSNMSFSSLIYKDISGSSDVNMTASLPANYGPTNIIYGKDYLPVFNGGDVVNPEGTLLGTGRMTRLIDLGVGTTQCPSESQFNLQGNISAYVANPRVRVDFSYIKDQEAWFQVGGAGVKAKNGISSGVPATMDSASRALSISGTNADNALVSFTSFSNINGFNDDSGYGTPNNWWLDHSTNDLSSYSYQYFYNNFLINNGVGVTGTDWSGRPSEGVYFVNGNLNIDSDFALDPGKTMIMVVKGKISIAEAVSRVDGIYIANGGIEALGVSANQLVINGMLYSRANIRLARSFENKILNNTTPPVKVNYQTNLIFNLPGNLMRVLNGWREQ